MRTCLITVAAPPTPTPVEENCGMRMMTEGYCPLAVIYELRIDSMSAAERIADAVLQGAGCSGPQCALIDDGKAELMAVGGNAVAGQR